MSISNEEEIKQAFFDLVRESFGSLEAPVYGGVEDPEQARRFLKDLREYLAHIDCDSPAWLNIQLVHRLNDVEGTGYEGGFELMAEDIGERCLDYPTVQEGPDNAWFDERFANCLPPECCW